GQLRHHPHPGRLLHEQPESVIRPGKLLNLAVAEKVEEALRECFQVRAEPRPHHDAVGIDGLAVLAVSLSGTDGAEEAVSGEKPHGSILGWIPGVSTPSSLLQSLQVRNRPLHEARLHPAGRAALEKAIDAASFVNSFWRASVTSRPTPP